MSFSKSHKPVPPRKPFTPQVADREPRTSDGSCLDLSINPVTEDVKQLNDYRVFLKRNLKPLVAPTDLLANIQARLAAIDAEKL